ncbi:DEKNAAC103263 [Brettanomyces naardenensis]|uniref:DEKNAAC103263 n=1 Tax=Brettanomyces naardenensis TaxID=13370 RepID=A0A448YMW3_BRENA|nr:DEKNAAC103263 [Brettanomyces naardenensis]
MSFDPVHDSIAVNKGTEDGSSQGSIFLASDDTIPPPSPVQGSAATAHPTSLTSLLNPEGPQTISSPITPENQTTSSPNTPEEKKTTLSDLLLYVPGGKPVETKKRRRRTSPNKKRKFFVKETQKEPDQKESRNYQTLLINSRARHLKKQDGEPYWRREIQFEFLLRLFFNNRRVFHNPYYDTNEPYDWPDHFRNVRNDDGTVSKNDGRMVTFFELYLITLLKSNKVSKILKDRMLLDINYALNFCVICLLVNIGRLNTTVNFDYEMKSQFRTYHPIPSLQVGSHLDVIDRFYKIDEEAIKHRLIEEDGIVVPKEIPVSPNPSESATFSSIRGGSGYTISTVKQLQDTPRIKSILKSINDLNSKIPKSYKEFVSGMSDDNKFNLNIVSLIFLLCVHEVEIGRAFFPEERELDEDEVQKMKDHHKPISTGSLFNDIWLRPDVKPQDKVNRFLWLLFLFKETGFKTDGILSNPFNRPDHGLKVQDFNPNAKIGEELTSHNKYINEKTRVIVPEISYIDLASGDDPLLNDDDTPAEVAFGERMKSLRLNFVKEQAHGPEQPDSQPEAFDESVISTTPRSILPDVETTSEPETTAAVLPSAEFSKVATSAAKASNGKAHDEAEYERVHFTAKQLAADDEPIRKRRLRGKLSFSDSKLRHKVKPSISSVEAGAADPYELEIMEEHYERSSLRKKKKKTLDLPIRLTRSQIEILLNSEIKAINANSKNAISKRHRNGVYSLFMKDLLDYKMDQIQLVRMKEGNLKVFDKIDPNMLASESQKSKENEEDKESDYDFGDYGEFKVHYFKELNRINIAMNHRELVKMRDSELKHEERVRRFKEATSFVDEAMKKLDV